jgi:hypothetical protein
MDGLIIFLYNYLVATILYDPIMNNTASYHNVYLVEKGKNGVASSRILNLLLSDPNARSNITRRDECLRLNSSFSFCTGLTPPLPLIQVVPNNTKRGQESRLRSISNTT